MTIAKALISSSGANSFVWNLSYADYDNSKAFDIANSAFHQGKAFISDAGFAFRPDGTKIGAVRLGSSALFGFDLSTPWDVSTLSSAGSGGFLSPMYGFIYRPDGTNAYGVAYGASFSSIIQYPAVAYSPNLNLGTSFSVRGEVYFPYAAFLSSDGTKMFVAGEHTGPDQVVHKYTLGTPWNVTTASSAQNLVVSSDFDSVSGLSFKPDGSEMYVLGVQSSQSNLRKYTLSSAWDLSTASLVGSKSVQAEDASPTDVYLRTDGLRFYVAEGVGSDLNEYVVGAFSVDAQEASPSGIAFSADGGQMYVVGASGDINEYALSIPWQSYSAAYTQAFDVSAQEASPLGITFAPDGLGAFIVGSGSGFVRKYTLSVAWDISTAALTQSYDVSSQDIEPSDIRFRIDGLVMYVLGKDGADINQYALSAPWDISAPTYVQNFSVSAQTSAPEGFHFRVNGASLYVSSGGNIYEYYLSSAWDVSTASYVRSLNAAANVSDAQGVAFKPDGKRLHIMDGATRCIHEYIIDV